MIPENAVVQIVILASGNSTRFGADKRLLTLPRVLTNIFQAIGDYNGLNILCVLKADDKHHLDALLGKYHNDKRLSFCWNTTPEAGIGKSIALAANALIDSTLPTDAVMIFLADMPYIQINTILQLIALANRARIVAPVYQSRRGHPVIFGSDYFAELQQLQGDRGARDVIAQHATNVVLVDVDDKGVIIDIDTSDDWQQAQRDFSL